jgi:hypothetical protein
MKTLCTLLFIAFATVASADERLAQINQLSKQQQTLLLSVLAEKDSAEKQLIEAQTQTINVLNANVESQKSIAKAVAENELRQEHIKELEGVAKWYEEHYVEEQAKAQKQTAIAHKFRMVLWGIIALFSTCLTTLILIKFGDDLQFAGIYGLIVPLVSFFGSFGLLAIAVEVIARL